MMNRIAVAAGCVLLGMGGQVAAGCAAASRVQDVISLLSGNTVCGTGQGPNAGDQWQEWHQTGGTLTEYAKGSASTVDPTHDVGNWAVTSNGSASATVTHKYGAVGGPWSYQYTWAVYDNGDSTYSFCTGDSGTEVASAPTPAAGQVNCGFF